jgi:hypothetical protein
VIFIPENLAELQQAFAEHSAAREKECNEWWNSLSEEDRLRAFYSVVKRIHKGDIEDKGSYRWVLYNVFGFGPEAYGLGMDCGYMDLHNAIYDGEDVISGGLLKDFCKDNNIENAEEKISAFIQKRYV